MKAQQLKNAILQLAIQGKLVPQDPNDEPASVLFEKIQAEKEKLIAEGKIKKTKKTSNIRPLDRQIFLLKFLRIGYGFDLGMLSRCHPVKI